MSRSAAYDSVSHVSHQGQSYSEHRGHGPFKHTDLDEKLLPEKQYSTRLSSLPDPKSYHSIPYPVSVEYESRRHHPPPRFYSGTVSLPPHASETVALKQRETLADRKTSYRGDPFFGEYSSRAKMNDEQIRESDELEMMKKDARREQRHEHPFAEGDRDWEGRKQRAHIGEARRGSGASEAWKRVESFERRIKEHEGKRY